MTNNHVLDPPVQEASAAGHSAARAFHLHASQRIERPVAEVFAFFADPRCLEEITPPRLRFKLRSTSQEPIGEGAEIDYRLRLRGVPVRWRSLITCWSPPHRIGYEQVRGPYRRWHHVHTFHALADGATMVVDYVEFSVPGGRLFEGLVERFFVRPDIERIFAWRRQRIAKLLAGSEARPSADHELLRRGAQTPQSRG